LKHEVTQAREEACVSIQTEQKSLKLSRQVELPWQKLI